MSMRLTRRQLLAAGSAFALSSAFVNPLPAASGPHIPIPGTGRRAAGTGDDFEDPNWTYTPNGAKSSWNLDKQQRLPGGVSSNRLWVEAAMRGQPDLVKRIDTPPNGPPGSGSMLMQSLHSGIPGRPAMKPEQDDFLHDISRVVGGQIPIYRLPNVITRVYLPAFTQWEKRTGNSFGFRVGLRATHKKKDEETKVTDYEEYWPGFFVAFNYNRWKQGGVDSAYLAVRSDSRGRDLQGPALKEATWYTLGMSFTADGQVHYFVREGVEGLRAADHLCSHFPYGYKAKNFETLFFNTVCNDDGRTWSTPWTVDETYLHYSEAGGVSSKQGRVR